MLPTTYSEEPETTIDLLLVSGRGRRSKATPAGFFYLKIRQIEGLLLLFRLFFRNIVRISTRCVRLNLLNHVRTMGLMILKFPSFMNHGWLPNRVRDGHLPWDKDFVTKHLPGRQKNLKHGIFLASSLPQSHTTTNKAQFFRANWSNTWILQKSNITIVGGFGVRGQKQVWNHHVDNHEEMVDPFL